MMNSIHLADCLHVWYMHMIILRVHVFYSTHEHNNIIIGIRLDFNMHNITHLLSLCGFHLSPLQMNCYLALTQSDLYNLTYIRLNN